MKIVLQSLKFLWVGIFLISIPLVSEAVSELKYTTKRVVRLRRRELPPAPRLPAGTAQGSGSCLVAIPRQSSLRCGLAGGPLSPSHPLPEHGGKPVDDRTRLGKKPTSETASSEGSDDLWLKKVKIGGEFRARVESQFNYDFNSAVPNNDTFYLLRTRIYLDLNPIDQVQLFAMFQDSETLDQGSALVKTPDRHKFYQGYVKFKGNVFPLKTYLKLGRQELNYGDQRLVGSFWWGNLGRSFDGAVWRLENDDFWLDLFGTRIHPAQGIENQFAGAYGHWKKFPGGELEPYVLYLHGEHSGLNKGELHLATLGARIRAKFKENFDYALEGAYQAGTSSGNRVSAFASHFRFGYTFPVSYKPRLGIEYNFASGDRYPTTGTVTTFNNLFPTNHDKYGYMDLFGWRNLHNVRASVSAQPLSWLKPSLDYHIFFLPEPANGPFMANGAALRAGSATASSFAGQEVDLLIKFEPIKYFDAWVGYSIFFPGKFFSDTGPSDTAHFLYTQLTARY